MRPLIRRRSERVPSDLRRPAILCRFLLASIFAVASAGTAGADVLELTASRDNTMFEEADLSNGAGPDLFAGSTGTGSRRRALILFDLEGRLPLAARVDSVTVTLQVSRAPNDIPRRIGLHRVLRDWGEGASIATGGAGSTAEVGDATWRDAIYPGRRWLMPGGDFEPVASSARAVEGIGSYTWRGVGLTTDVRAWLAQPGSNAGWLLEGETGANTARRFASRETNEFFARPTITIHYTPASVARSNSWGSLKARYR